MAKDKNYVSVWLWLLIIVITSVPCFGIFFGLIFAFSGENESRKNFFKAYLAFYLLILFLTIGLSAAGVLPNVLKKITESSEHWPQFLKGP